MKPLRMAVMIVFDVILMSSAIPTYASTVRWYDGDTTIYPYLYYYGTPRTVSYSPYGIAVLKYDGPSMYWETHDCSGNYSGFWASIPNTDPAPWVWLKPNNSTPSQLDFCLAIRNTSGTSPDSFDALMEWDGY